MHPLRWTELSLALLLLLSMQSHAGVLNSSLPTASPAQTLAADPAVLFSEGKAALQHNDLTQAEKSFRAVIALDPNSGAARINLGVVYMRSHRWEDALVELKQAQTLLPQEPGVRLNIGLAYYRKDDYASAILPLSEALQMQPASRQARYLLGLCQFFTNHYRDADEVLFPLWEQDSSNLNYLYVLSIAASKAKDEARQKLAFDRMLTVGQNNPQFHLYIGKAFLAEDATGKALDEFKAAAAAQSDMPLVHYFLGRVYLEQHAYPEAEAEFVRDIAIEPTFAYNYEDLGILCSQTNQPQRAEQYFREAVTRNSSLVNSWFGLAKLYRDDGHYQMALDTLDRALALAPTSASVHYTRGQVLVKLGQQEAAQREFTRTAELHKSFNDRLQQDPLGEASADAQSAAQE